MLSAFKRMFETSRMPMALLTLSGDFKQVNQAFSRLLGWETGDLGGRNFLTSVELVDSRVDFSNISHNLSNGHPVFFVESQFARKNKIIYPLLWTAYPDYTENIIWLIIHETIRPDENQELFKLAVEASPTGILVISIGTIIYANRIVESIFGYSQEELLGQPIELLIPPHLRTIHQSYRDHYSQEPYLRLMGSALTLVGQRKDGRICPVDIGLNPVRTTDGLVVVCSVIDLSARKEAEQILAHKIQNLKNRVGRLDKLSKTDALTAIQNRRALDMQLEYQYRTAQKNGQPVSFLLLDVDDFKHYNDSYGHLAGDEVLKFLAKIMIQTLRHTEIIARYGGEEFGILLPGSNLEESIHTAQRLRKEIEEFECPFQRITVSIGCATVFPKPTTKIEPEDINNFIKMADKALYYSKYSGKNCVTHFNQLALIQDEKLSDWNIKYKTPPEH